MPEVADPRRRSYRRALLAVLVGAGVWRAVMAAAAPVISRDGVTFCWHARALGERGWAYLRDPTFQQHPLYPALILGVQRAARALGAPDTPLTWQYSGQLVSWLSGLTVIALVGVLALRLVRRLALPVNERLTALLAMLLAAVLDLNVWLSSDVMSEQVHLTFYLAAVVMLVRLDRARTALIAGLLSGAAFLTRQEGFVPALAGIVALSALGLQRSPPPRGPHVGRAAALLAGFALLATPYWLSIGGLSQKKDPLKKGAGVFFAAAQRPPTADSPPLPDGRKRLPPPFVAKLETQDWPWYALVPEALYKLLRAGRVVIPLLAVPPLLNLRRQWLGPGLGGVTLCVALHFALTLALVHQYDYLAPRHMLVIVVLLTPFAALLLGRIVSLLSDVQRRGLGAILVALCLLPSAAYAARIPNSRDAFLRDAANWLRAHDPQVAAKRLLSGSSPRRIAFYADLRWDYWPEQPEAYESLVWQIRRGGPGYFAIEVGPGFERHGNRELVDKLRADERLQGHLGDLHERPGPSSSVRLYLLELCAAQPPRATPTEPPAAPSPESPCQNPGGRASGPSADRPAVGPPGGIVRRSRNSVGPE